MVGWNTDSIVSAVQEICPLAVPRLVHISFTVTAAINQAAVDNVVRTVSFDWFRYAWNCYFAWTTLHAESSRAK